MLVRKLRLKRGWSQSQLAEMAGVTTRTIQRLERGHKPSLETGKALAAVFEVDHSLFHTQEIENMNDMTHTPASDASETPSLKQDEQEALQYARRMKEFYQFLLMYLSMAALFLTVFKLHPVVLLVFGTMGVGVIVQGLIAYEVIDFIKPDWEKRIAEKRLGRKL